MWSVVAVLAQMERLINYCWIGRLCLCMSQSSLKWKGSSTPLLSLSQSRRNVAVLAQMERLINMAGFPGFCHSRRSPRSNGKAHQLFQMQAGYGNSQSQSSLKWKGSSTWSPNFRSGKRRLVITVAVLAQMERLINIKNYKQIKQKCRSPRSNGKAHQLNLDEWRNSGNCRSPRSNGKAHQPAIRGSRGVHRCRSPRSNGKAHQRLKLLSLVQWECRSPRSNGKAHQL